MLEIVKPDRVKSLILRFSYNFNRVRRHGFLGVSKRVIIRSLKLVLGVILIPAGGVAFALGYRRPLFFLERIGHLAIEPDTLLKSELLGLVKPRKWVVFVPTSCVANQALLDYWREYFSIYTNPIACFFLDAVFYFPWMKYDVSYFINNNSGKQFAYEVNAKWGDRSPLLKLSDADNFYCDNMLAKLGVPKDAWFVCVHAREGGFSPVDEELQSHRNSKISSLAMAIKEIVNRDGYVIRIGDPSMVRLDPAPNVIDYAHDPLRNPRLDVALCARAKFILGNTSGIFLVGTVFGTPSVLVNMIPMPSLGLSQHDISIPKLYRDKVSGRVLTFNEVMGSELSSYRFAPLFAEKKVSIEDNSAEDILSATVEMLDRVDGKFAPSTEDERMQKAYLALMTTRHCSYGAASLVATTFLRKYQSLLT